MRCIAPDYYLKFHCIGGKCRHNCCIGWEIDIDEDTLAYYQSIDGELGERLRQNICLTDETPHFILGAHERCPFLNDENLCDLILAQGEGALCQICDDHPRFYNEWNGVLEMGVGLCCEEAARLIVSGMDPVEMVTVEDDGQETPRDRDTLNLQLRRELMLYELRQRDIPLEKRLMQLLEEVKRPLPARAYSQWAAFYQSLEQLDPAWNVWLEKLKHVPLRMPGAKWDVAFERLTHYFMYRHVSDVYSDEEFSLKTAFAVLSVCMIRALCGVVIAQKGTLEEDDLVDIARMYSSEIEYSSENVEAIINEIAKN